MRFFNHRPDDPRQWHDYQALELIPASTRRSPHWARPFISIMNRLVVTLRPIPTTHKAQVDRLEACWRQAIPTMKPQATDDLPLPGPRTPLLWLFDATFDPAPLPRRIKPRPTNPWTQF